MHRVFVALARLWRAVTRERAVIAGVALAVLEAAQAGQITRTTAVPVIAGVILRCFVSPANEVHPAAGVNLESLSDTDQARLLADTDNSGPPDGVVLPQDPGSRVE